ncbi:hypothetical protein MKJ04_20150 [Pontibacter sp. E15-1]|uniref:hypothetical protein n=1 Tax=Pontibacter sp. E15-1 TaxID=2919918 RepID=UPI001F4FF92C|nr:hypothetical protein [Pontibacter sp. E15-1]MCJ8167164.1 hypothetical protein [Pontibacter sp. E15-1]
MRTEFVTAIATIAVIVALAIIIYVFSRSKREETKVRYADYDGANKALERLGDWAKWMSGIQTAVLGAVGFIIDKVPVAGKDNLMSLTTTVVILLIGAGLFCSAWVLSALPSITIRVPQKLNVKQGIKVPTHYDVYEYSLYGIFKGIRLVFMVTLQHWLWALGLLAFGFLLLQFSQLPPSPSSSPCTIQIQD